MTRHIRREDETKRAARLSRFATDRPAEIEKWIDAKVPDPGTREVLKEFAKVVCG